MEIKPQKYNMKNISEAPITATHDNYNYIKNMEMKPTKYTKTLYRSIFYINGRRYRMTTLIYKGKYKVVIESIDKYHKTFIIMNESGVVLQKTTANNNEIIKEYKFMMLDGWCNYKHGINIINNILLNDFPYIGMSYYKIQNNPDIPIYQQMMASV